MIDPPVLDSSNPELAGIASPPIAAAVYRSTCTSSTAKMVATRYRVPREYGLCAPNSDQLADEPPPGYAAIYTHQFRYGLRLPLQQFMVSVLSHYRLAIAQIHPHSIILMLGFMEVCKRASIEPSLTLFRHFFQLGKCPNLKGEWYTFYQTVKLRIVHGLPTSGSRWKTSFLFFMTEPMEEDGVVISPWNYSPVEDKPISDREKPSAETIEKLLANAYEYQAPLAFQGENRIIELDVRVASSQKSYSRKKAAPQRKRAKKSCEENELAPSLCATEEPNNMPTDNNGRLQRMAGLAASLENKPASALSNSTGKKSMDESSEIPSFKETVPGLFTGDNEELKKFLTTLERDAEDMGDETVDIQGERKELDEVCMDMEQDVNDMDDEIALVQREKNELEKAVVAMEQAVKDKDMEISSIQDDKKELEKVMADKDLEIDLLHGHVAEMERALLEKNKDIELLNFENSKLKNVSNDEIASLKAEVSRLQGIAEGLGYERKSRRSHRRRATY